MSRSLAFASTSRAVRLAQIAIDAGVALDNVWLVGGSVRDAALGRDPVDIDLAVAGDALAFARQLAHAAGGTVVAEHDFGTATVTVPEPSSNVVLVVDIAATRTEEYTRPGALPDVATDASIDTDLARRDFTINALAAPFAAPAADTVRWIAGTVGEPLPQSWHDDLDEGIIRVLHDRSFLDDPTRIFRAARYAGRLEFHLESATAQLAQDALKQGAFSTISAQRLSSEFVLILREVHAARSLHVLRDIGAFTAIDEAFDASARAGLSLVAAIDDACESDENDATLSWHARMAALLLELDNDAATRVAQQLLTRSADVRAVLQHRDAALLVQQHEDQLPALTLGEVRDMLGTAVSSEVLAFAALATHRDAATAVRAYSEALHECKLTITGHDIIAMGVPRASGIGVILDEVHRRKLMGELHSKEDELACAQAFSATLRTATDRSDQ